MSTLPESFDAATITRLKDVVYEGVRTQEEIETLRAGISDVCKSIAEELNIPAKLLKKVISIAHKNNYAENVGAYEE